MFRITTVTKNLLIINILMFAATWVFDRQGLDLNRLLGLHFILAPNFSIYQFFTYMFMHANFEHLFFNMFALWMFGCVVENVLGAKRFLFFYLSCGVGAGIIQEVAQFVSFYFLASGHGYGLGDLMIAKQVFSQYLSLFTTVGASGAIYAILLAFGMLFPNERIFIFPLPIPIKAKWFVCFYIALELFFALATTNDSVAHFAHLGGMFFAWIMLRYWRNNSDDGNDGRNKGRQFFENLKNNWERRSNKKADQDYDNSRNESDWEYNARKKKEQDEIDRILDKVRRSGYESLTEEEKRKLFDGGKR